LTRTPPIVVFLSAGRCGTQWLAVTLGQLHPQLHVEHEPIGCAYKPRLYFRRYGDPEAILEVGEVARHVEAAAACSKPYVETGWPCFPVLPLLARRLGDRLRVVHLTRHPVPSALSHLSHNAYAGSWRCDVRWATFGPRDANLFQVDYQARWRHMSAYEKCLFWWTEVQLFALEFAERFDQVPFRRVKYEDLFGAESEQALRSLTSFMDLPWSDGWHEHIGRRVDLWHHYTDEPFDVSAVLRHPRTVQAAAALGYRLDDLDQAEFETRYRGKPPPTRRNRFYRITRGPRRITTRAGRLLEHRAYSGR
jgi:hypothetical protein